MGNEGQPVNQTDLVDQPLGVAGVRAQLAASAKDQEMVLLGLAQGIVDFFAHQQQDLAAALLKISFYAIDEDIMVGGDERIQAGFQGSPGDLGMGLVTVRVGRVHMEV